ncbi:MAG TPA: hypothetical protein VNP72_03215 [Longimicrobium sp.]|nr:hypothetical protein [Longimicrobium sp.]
MRKLVLRVEDLRVESFDTAWGEGRRGTVAAHEATWSGPCGTVMDAESCAAGCTHEICSNPCTDVC